MSSGIFTRWGGEYESTQTPVAATRMQHAKRTGHMDYTTLTGGFQATCDACGEIVNESVNEWPEKQMPDVVAEYQAVIDEWGIPAGSVLVVRDRVETLNGEVPSERSPVIMRDGVRDDGTKWQVLGDEDRGVLMQTFQPWATVLMVGDPYITDFGQTVNPPPIKPGMRVLIAATAAEDIELPAGGETMRVTLVSFRAIKLWRKA